MSAIHWLQLSLIFFLGAATPGPSLVYILNKAIITTRRDAILIAIGHGLGVTTLASLALLGVNTLLLTFPTLEIVLKWVSIVALITFGVVTLYASNSPLMTTISDNKSIRKRLGNVLKGYTFAITNPLVLIFFGALFSQFNLTSLTLFAKFIAILLLFIMDSGCYIAIILGIRATRFLTFITSYKKRICITSGIVLIAIALSFMLE